MIFSYISLYDDNDGEDDSEEEDDDDGDDGDDTIISVHLPYIP